MEPTIEPTTEPTLVPTSNATVDPTKEFSFNPTLTPSNFPSSHPTNRPTFAPSMMPSFPPSTSPTAELHSANIDHSTTPDVDTKTLNKNKKSSTTFISALADNGLIFGLSVAVIVLLCTVTVLICLLMRQNKKKKMKVKKMEMSPTIASGTDFTMVSTEPGSTMPDDGEGNTTHVSTASYRMLVTPTMTPISPKASLNVMQLQLSNEDDELVDEFGNANTEYDAMYEDKMRTETAGGTVGNDDDMNGDVDPENNGMYDEALRVSTIDGNVVDNEEHSIKL